MNPEHDRPVLLELKGLSKAFGPEPETALGLMHKGMGKAEILRTTGNVLAVNNVSLDIREGEIFVVMGLSGSGKSTLIRMVNRLIEPTAGTITLENENITALSRRQLIELRRQKMSMVFQSFALLPHASVLDNVAFGLRVSGEDRKKAEQRAREALEMVGIPEVAGHFPDQLSGGMQQRVGLARAWVTETDIMLMDEAFSALDPMIRAEMQDGLLELQRTAKRTIIFISHDLGEAVRIADRIAVMADGEVRQVGRPAEIMKNPADEYVCAFFRDVRTGFLLTAGDIAVSRSGTAEGPRISAETRLEDIIPIAAENDDALVVTGKKGNIIGFINRKQLLSGLAKGKFS